MSTPWIKSSLGTLIEEAFPRSMQVHAASHSSLIMTMWCRSNAGWQQLPEPERCSWEDNLSPWMLGNKVCSLQRQLMAGDKLLGTWNRGDTEKEPCVEQEMESQTKELSHSIEEILRRPTCVRKEKRAHRNWSVIKENTRISNQLSCTGGFYHSFFFLLFF